MSLEFLVDTSAWNRSTATADLKTHWMSVVASERVALCPPVKLELLFSARGRADYEALADELEGLPSLDLGRQAVRRAEQVQAMLAGKSQHRGPNPVDLYVAAIAELNDTTLVHYDRHFDAIARITGQQTEWIAPRGTLD